MDFDLILASASPRRHEILTLAGIPHRVLTAPADESRIPFPKGNPAEYVMALAKLKNDAVCELVRATHSGRGPVILSADTVVWSREMSRPLGKPKDAEDARRMLASLSGREHEVWTGVMLRDLESGRESLFAEVTEVFFRELEEEEIRRYVDSGDALDKAGSYGYQSGACAFVRGIRGDYYNVVGLPICRITTELRLLRSPAPTHETGNTPKG